MDNVIDVNVDNYKGLLKNYTDKRDEKSLYRAEQLSKSLIKSNVLPDEIVNIHNQAMAELYPDLYQQIQHSMNFLLETMIFYGLAHQQYQTLREDQLNMKSEIAVAASMQETFLASNKPEISGLDIGVISVPAEQMNGDYYNFIKGQDGSLGVALADVIGKGVPAALCMSMIKYAMDSFSKDSLNPKGILEMLNRVVEKNVDASMFITMFYAKYLPAQSKLVYASAGHEPGFYFQADKQTFHEIHSEGLVLGVLPDNPYKQFELTIEKNDMVILLTDGVTECRQGDRFIEREEVMNVIHQYVHLPAQGIVDEVYKYFERLQDFQLKDDFTMIILRREV